MYSKRQIIRQHEWKYNLLDYYYCRLFLICISLLFVFGESFATTTPPSRMPGQAKTYDQGSSGKAANARGRHFDTTLRSSSLGEESDSDYFHNQGSSKETAARSDENLKPKNQKLFSVGIIADIQYAPIPDGHSYSGQERYYKHALEVAKHAFHHFEQEKVDLVVNLGDILDGKCQDIIGNGGAEIPPTITDPGLYSLDHVLDAISSYKNGRTIHSYGNHCLYNLDRSTLGEKLGIPFVTEPCGDLVGYSSHVHQGVRFVVIDSYDISLMQRCEKTSQKYQEATAILGEKNPNFPHNFNSPEGLEELDRRFVGFNGGVGSRQLTWLRTTLEEARIAQEKVVAISHQPIAPPSSHPVCLIWNYDEVLDVLRDYSDVVVASFSGHAHKGGYIRDSESGIHFRVFEAALENRPERTYAIVDVHNDSLVVRGYGNCQSAEYDFSHVTQAT